MMIAFHSLYFLAMIIACMYISQVFRDSNITITYSSEFERFPPESYIESVLMKTKEEGRSEICFRNSNNLLTKLEF